MGLLSFLRRAAPPAVEKSAGVPAQGFLPSLGAMPSAAGTMISQATAMTDGAVYACVTIRSEDVARCRPRLFRPLPDGSREEVKDHPVAKLFVRPNRLQTWFEFCYQMHAGYLLKDNAYAVILRDRRGDPTEMIPINPDAAMILEAADGSLFYNINRVGLFQMAALRDLPLSIPAEDVLHLRGLAFNMTYGYPRIGFARDAIGLAMALAQQAARWVKNGAFPHVVLKMAKKLTEDVAKRLQNSWNSLFGGLQGVGSTCVLEDGIEAQELKLTAADLQFQEQRKSQVIEVARFWRMPPHKVGITDGASKMNLPQADQDYVNNTIMPDLERWEQKLGRTFDLDREGLEVDLDESALLRADVITRYTIGRLGGLSGLTTTNEWRHSEKLKPMPGGDALRAPVNMAAVGSDVSGTAADDAGRPRDGTSDALPEA